MTRFAAMNDVASRSSRHIEQAAGLLDVTNERELEAFLRRLIDDAVRRSGGALSAQGARAVLAVVKKAAERTLSTLTTVSRAGEQPTDRPGGSPAATAARMYGLELEGLSAEDRDFEIARQLARFTEAATRQAAHSPSPPPAGVSAAIGGAVREFAPGLLATRRPIATGPWSGDSAE